MNLNALVTKADVLEMLGGLPDNAAVSCQHIDQDGSIKQVIWRFRLVKSTLSVEEVA